jgi:deazaflavin-dependent oxidoreductase (nitroreductase family)
VVVPEASALARQIHCLRWTRAGGPFCLSHCRRLLRPAYRAHFGTQRAARREMEEEVKNRSLVTQPSMSQGLDQVHPSPLVRTVVRPMTKVLNPLMGKFAGRRHFPMAAAVYHIGRQSGREYVTIVGARFEAIGFIIPLTFGNQSDWARNVRAAGRCRIRFRGQDYEATQPLLLGSADARAMVRPAFNPAMRLIFKMLGIKQFMRLRSAPPG